MSRAHYPSQGQSGRRPLSLTLLGPLSAAIHPFLTSAYPQGPPGGKCKPSAHTDNMVQGHLSLSCSEPQALNGVRQPHNAPCPVPRAPPTETGPGSSKLPGPRRRPRSPSSWPRQQSERVGSLGSGPHPSRPPHPDLCWGCPYNRSIPGGVCLPHSTLAGFPNGALTGDAKGPPHSPHRRRARPGSRLQGEDPGPACLCCLDSHEPHAQGRPVAAPQAVPRDGARPHSARGRGRERGIPAALGQAFPRAGFSEAPGDGHGPGSGALPAGTPHTGGIRKAGWAVSLTYPPPNRKQGCEAGGCGLGAGASRRPRETLGAGGRKRSDLRVEVC